MRLSLLLLFAILVTEAHAQPVPIWSTAESQVTPFTASYSSAAPAILENGDALLVAGESSREGYASTVRLSLVGTTRGQFGGEPINGGPLVAEAVLATQGEFAVLRMTERQGEFNSPRALVVMVDAAGQIRWLLPRFGREARFLANGDVLLNSRNQVIRLRGSDGDLVWVRNLLDLRSDAIEAALWLPQEIGPQLILGIDFTERARDGQQIHPAPSYLSLDLATGATLWERRRAATSRRAFQACGNVAIGGDPVFAWFETTGVATDVVLERLAATDGALLWSARTADVEYSDGPCGFAATNSLVAISSHDEFTGLTTLAALSHAGAALWRHHLPVRAASKLVPGAAGALLIASPALLPGDIDGSRIEARRVSDGGVAWSTPIEAPKIDWRVLGSELRVAGAVVDQGAATLLLRRLDVTTGALLPGAQTGANGRSLLAANVEFIDGVPFAARSTGNLDLREIVVKRSEPETGAPTWTRTHLLTQTPQRITFIDVVAIPAGRLLVRVNFQITEPTVQNVLTLLVIDRNSGNEIWQRDFALGNFGSPSVIGTSDGSLYARSTVCANPPACTNIQNQLEKLGSVNGATVWTQQGNFSPLAARGVDLIGIRDTNQLTLVSAGNGAAFWSQVLPNSQSIPGFVALDNGDIGAMLEFRSGPMRKLDIQRRSAANGVPLWSTRPGEFDDVIVSGLLSELPDGDLLMTARFSGPEQVGRSRPLLARVDADTGALLWTQRPLSSGDRWQSVRAMLGATATHKWARSLRYLDDLNVQYEERFALTSVRLLDGAIGPEHLFARNYDEPLASAGFGTVFAVAVAGDGTVQVENSRPDSMGLRMPRLQRWPAVGSEHGDIVVRRLGDAGDIVGLGPSVDVEFEIELASASSATDAKAGFVSNEDGLLAILRGCTVVGGGQCPTNLNSALEQSLSLGPNAVMRLRYEVFDQSFRPGEQPNSRSRAIFHVDPPYMFGDDNLGNNIHVMHVSLGGMSDGFE